MNVVGRWFFEGWRIVSGSGYRYISAVLGSDGSNDVREWCGGGGGLGVHRLLAHASVFPTVHKLCMVCACPLILSPARSTVVVLLCTRPSWA